MWVFPCKSMTSRMFITSGNDNDLSAVDNCAVQYHGGRWYRNCYESNLNGRYYAGDYGNYDGNNATAVQVASLPLTLFHLLRLLLIW